MVECLKKWPLLVLCAGLLVVAGCGQAETELAGTPTVDSAAIVAPPTPLVTPSPGELPAGSPEASATGESGHPDDEKAETPAPTVTRSVTTPAATETEAAPGVSRPTSGPTPQSTDTLRPTDRPRPSPTAPAPPSPTPHSDAAVDYFRANVAEADPGDAISLEWATSNAETVTLWRLMATGQLAEFWDVEATGSFDYTIAEHARNRITFALAVTPGEGELGTSMTTLEIPLRCPDSWFFDNPPDICPARAALVSAGAEQHFQGGVMLWSAAEDRIYVLFGGGQDPEWSPYTDEWDPGEPENDPTLSPPAGFYQPVRGFGQVWREQPGVRERLGWAIGEEVAYQTAVQRTSYAKYNETYIQAADDGVWRLEAERSGWGKQ